MLASWVSHCVSSVSFLLRYVKRLTPHSFFFFALSVDHVLFPVLAYMLYVYFVRVNRHTFVRIFFRRIPSGGMFSFIKYKYFLAMGHIQIFVPSASFYFIMRKNRLSTSSVKDLEFGVVLLWAIDRLCSYAVNQYFVAYILLLSSATCLFSQRQTLHGCMLFLTYCNIQVVNHFALFVVVFLYFIL